MKPFQTFVATLVVFSGHCTNPEFTHDGGNLHSLSSICVIYCLFFPNLRLVCVCVIQPYMLLFVIAN